MSRAARTARRLPATLALSALLIALMVATTLHAPSHSVLVQRLGVSWRDLQQLRLWRVATSSLVQDDTGVVWPIVALLPALALDWEPASVQHVVAALAGTAAGLWLAQRRGAPHP
jgi:hypothetical protein